MAGRCTHTRAAIAATLLLVASGVTPRAFGELSYSLEGVGGWPNQAPYNAAVAAIQSTVDRYNAYSPNGFDNEHVFVYYDAGIPTAQASYHGSIGFGGTYPNERVMMHELAHYLGLPSGNWGNLFSGGTWGGPRGDQLIRQFDGEQAELHGDSVHFWPYGLNFDNEGSEINRQRQVAMVYAMRGDLGIGPSSHPSSATTVTLTGHDPFGTSGFNYKTTWSDGYFPHAGADYYTGDFTIRTPASGNSFSFAGDALTIDNTNGTLGGLIYKGTGAGTVAFDDLRLDGGWVQHANGINNLFRLDGSLNVVSDSVISAKEGNIDVLADVTGLGDLSINLSDLPAEDNRYVTFRSANNNFVGDLVNQSRFELADGANHRFLIGAPGVNNAITGGSALATRLNGVFEFDLSGASTTIGDSWSLVTAANTSYGPTFNIPGFTNNGGVWRNGTFAFDQSTGVLMVVPPPTMWNINGGGLWSAPGNWTGGVPAANEEAVLGSILTAGNAPATIQLDVPATLNRLTFDNANRYVLSGANPLTLTGNAEIVAESGDHEVAVVVAGNSGLTVRGGGRVTLSAANTYGGDTNIQAGTLALAGNATIANSPNIHVQPGATFDVSGLASPFQVAGGQTLNNNSTSTVVGDVIAGSGSTVTGRGAFAGNLTAQAGAVIRVGGDTPILQPETLIDDFSGDLSVYTDTRILDANGGGSNTYTWQISRGSLLITTSSYDGIEQSALTRTDVSLDVGEEIRADYAHNFTGSQDIGLYVGAGTPTPDVRRDYVAIYMRNDGNLYSRGFNGTSEFPLAGAGAVDPDSLFIARTGTNTFELGYYSGESRVVITTRSVGNAAIGDAIGFYSDVRSTGTRGSLDDLWLLDPDMVLPDIVTVQGDLTLSGGSTLVFDLFDVGVNEKLVIGGIATLAGTLQVDLADAVVLSEGDDVDLFDFGSASGKFHNFNLPMLAAGLTWDTSRLSIDGVLSVAAAIGGDYNNDGVVDAADYTVWRDSVGGASLLNRGPGIGGPVGQADYSYWVTQFGNTIGSAGLATGSTVPEPATASLLVFCAAAIARCRRRARPF